MTARYVGDKVGERLGGSVGLVGANDVGGNVVGVVVVGGWVVGGVGERVGVAVGASVGADVIVAALEQKKAYV